MFLPVASTLGEIREQSKVEAKIGRREDLKVEKVQWWKVNHAPRNIDGSRAWVPSLSLVAGLPCCVVSIWWDIPRPIKRRLH